MSYICQSTLPRVRIVLGSFEKLLSTRLLLLFLHCYTLIICRVWWSILLPCHDLAKQLSYYLFFFSFLFLFFYLGLTIQKEVWESVMSQVSHSHSHMTGKVTVSYHMMSHDRSHDRCEKEVHRPCSSCISSIENLTGTLSSSPCQTLIKEQLA